MNENHFLGCLGPSREQRSGEAVFFRRKKNGRSLGGSSAMEINFSNKSNIL